MSISTISAGIVIIAATALLELMRKDITEEKKVFEEENSL